MKDTNKYRIGKVYISATNPNDAKEHITKAATEGINDYICVSNVRTVSLANKSAAYCEVMNKAFMCTPDGMPLVWLARLWGLKDVQRTVGPDLFMQMINDKESGLKHFLLGDTEETLNAMKKKFSDDNTTNIVGTFSPPFCELDEYNFEDIAKCINESRANIVWVSLRAPKQDYLAVRLLPYLDKKICIGVGAAFRFSLGQIKHPPKIFKRLGLTGIFWRKMDLSKIGWYFHHFALLCKWGCEILYSRIIGKKYFE